MGATLLCTPTVIRRRGVLDRLICQPQYNADSFTSGHASTEEKPQRQSQLRLRTNLVAVGEYVLEEVSDKGVGRMSGLCSGVEKMCAQSK